MKRLIGLGLIFMAVVIFFITFIPAAQAKPYKPLTISDYTAEIPDEVILPDYLKYLEWRHSVFKKTFDGSDLIISYFSDPDFQYFNKDGKEIFPYVEIIKIEYKSDGTASAHLVYIAFISEKGEVEIYMDKNAEYGPATDKLSQFKIPAEKKKKVPRQK